MDAQLKDRLARLASEGVLRELVDLFLQNPGKRWRDLDLARSLDALPLYGDIGGSIFLRADGTMLSLDHNSEELSEGVGHPWEIVALVAGAEKYPQLRSLLPERPANARDCTPCGGTGKVSVPGLDVGLGCGECWGLGWLPPL
jgi:hypothetical protein